MFVIIMVLVISLSFILCLNLLVDLIVCVMLIIIKSRKIKDVDTRNKLKNKLRYNFLRLFLLAVSCSILSLMFFSCIKYLINGW